MQPTRARQSLGIAWVALLFTQLIAAAHADPIMVPGYTVTNLGGVGGGGGPPTFSTDSSGNGIVIGANGQTYSFPQTPNTVLTYAQEAALPEAQAPYPATINDMPTFAFNNVTSAVMNANGFGMGIENTGTIGHEYTSTVFAMQQKPDGTWEPSATVQMSGPLYAGFAAPPETPIAFLSKSNEILAGGHRTPGLPYSAVLYNMNTQTLTSLTELLNPTGYTPLYPVAIDDRGQIVLNAAAYDPAAPDPYTETNILLTPDGVSSAPLEAPVPEPGALAVMLFAAASFAIGRVRERRRRSTGHQASL